MWRAAKKKEGDTALFCYSPRDMRGPATNRGKILVFPPIHSAGGLPPFFKEGEVWPGFFESGPTGFFPIPGAKKKQQQQKWGDSRDDPRPPSLGQ